MAFENKVVLITGAGSGMGEAAALLFAERGANVVIVDLNEETANATAEKCKKFGKGVLAVKADITKDEDGKNAIDKTIETFGRLDVLVNNAGILRKGNILTGDLMTNYEAVMSTNLRSVFLMTSLATPHLIKTKGNIINNSSISCMCVRNGAMYPVYATSKAGVNQFTRLTAAELAVHGIRANCINPGPVYTNVLKGAGLDGFPNMDAFAEHTALNRVADPREIAELIVFLAGDTAKSITGSIIRIDNGQSLL